MLASLLTQGHYAYSMCPDITFQILPPGSRPMTSHRVTCHVTSLSCALFIISTEKEKKIKKKKSKIRKNKIK